MARITHTGHQARTRDISIRVTPELYERLTDAALAEGRTRSDLVRIATELLLRVLEKERAERKENILRELLSESIDNRQPEQRGAR